MESSEKSMSNGDKRDSRMQPWGMTILSGQKGSRSQAERMMKGKERKYLGS